MCKYEGEEHCALTHQPTILGAFDLASSPTYTRRKTLEEEKQKIIGELEPKRFGVEAQRIQE